MPQFSQGGRYLVKPPVGSQINYGHDLSIGVQEAYPFNEGGGGKLWNAGPSGVGPLTSTAAVWSAALPQPYVTGLKVGASTQTCFTPSTVVCGAQNSFVIAFVRTAAATANTVVMLCRQANSTNNQIGIQYDGTAANLNLNMANSASTLQTLSIPAANIVLNALTLIAVSFDRSTGMCNAWVNGAAFTHAGSAVTGTTSTGYAVAIGASTTAGGSLAQTQSLLLRYNRLLSAGDAFALTDNPYQLWLPPALRRYWVAPAGGTAISISLADTLAFTDAQLTDDALTRSSALTLIEAETADTALTRTSLLAAAEAIIASGGQAMTDAATLAESSAQASGTAQSDTAPPVDTAATSTALTGADTAVFVDALLSAGGPSFTDLATLAESALYSLALTQADALAAADLVTWGTITTLLLALADTLALAESAASDTAAALADALSPAEAAILAGALSLADAATLAETIAAWVTEGRLTIPADMLGTLDHLGALAGALSLTDRLSPSDRLLFLVIQQIIHQLSGTLRVRQRQGGTLPITQHLGGTIIDG